MSTLRKSLQTLGSIIAIGGFIGATSLPATAQAPNPCAAKATKAANPCAPKAKKSGKAKKSAPTAANPCAPKAANPCAPKR